MIRIDSVTLHRSVFITHHLSYRSVCQQQHAILPALLTLHPHAAPSRCTLTLHPHAAPSRCTFMLHPHASLINSRAKVGSLSDPWSLVTSTTLVNCLHQLPDQQQHNQLTNQSSRSACCALRRAARCRQSCSSVIAKTRRDNPKIKVQKLLFSAIVVWLVVGLGGTHKLGPIAAPNCTTSHEIPRSPRLEWKLRGVGLCQGQLLRVSGSTGLEPLALREQMNTLGYGGISGGLRPLVAAFEAELMVRVLML